MVNVWRIASGIGMAEGAGFDVDNIIEQGIGVIVEGKPASAIPAQILAEGADVVRNFKSDPFGTSVNMAAGALIPEAMGRGLGYGLKAMGLPTGRSVFGMRIDWAIAPKKKSRKRRAKRRTTRKVYVSRKTGKRVKKPKTASKARK